jgi:hypothetical protein
VAPVQSDKDQTFVAPIVGLTHRRVHTDVRGDPGQDKVLNAFLPQEHVQVCRIERTFPRFVDHRLAVQWRQLLDDIPTRLAASENSPRGPGSLIPAPMRRLRQRLLAGRSERSGRCPSRGVHAVKVPRTRASSTCGSAGSALESATCHNPSYHISANPTKVSLHINDQQGGVFRRNSPFHG